MRERSDGSLRSRSRVRSPAREELCYTRSGATEREDEAYASTCVLAIISLARFNTARAFAYEIASTASS